MTFKFRASGTVQICTFCCHVTTKDSVVNHGNRSNLTTEFQHFSTTSVFRDFCQNQQQETVLKLFNNELFGELSEYFVDLSTRIYVLNRNRTLLRSNRGGTVSGETSTRFMARRNWAPKISLLFLFQIPQNRLRRALQSHVSAEPPTGKTYRNAQKGAQSMAT